MVPIRLNFLHRLWLLLAVVVFLPVGALTAQGRYRVEEVKPGIFVWVPDDIRDFDGDPRFSLPGTAGFIITSEGVVVVNTTNTPFHARELLFEIRQRTDQPVKYVIDTDARGDHMLGNEVFVDLKAEIVSSTATRAALERYHQDLLSRMEAEGEQGFRMQERMRGIHFTLPQQTFDDRITFMLGGREIRLVSPGGGPAPGDLAVLVPQAKAAFLGDWYENGYIPNLQNVDLEKWVQVLREMQKWDVDVYVPGRGAPGTRQDLEKFVKFLEWSQTQTPAGKPPRRNP